MFCMNDVRRMAVEQKMSQKKCFFLLLSAPLLEHHVKTIKRPV